MNIDDTSAPKPLGVERLLAKQDPDHRDTPIRAVPPVVPKADEEIVTFSRDMSQARLIQQEIDKEPIPSSFNTEKLQKICQALKSGTYQIDVEQIADALLQQTTELLLTKKTDR